MPLSAILVYLVLCLIVGISGRERSSGFWGAFIGAFFLTPFVIALILLLTQPRN